MQRLNAIFGLFHPLAAFELERLGHNTHGQNTQFTGGLCDDRGRTGTGTTAHPSRDKAHMRPGQVINDLFNAFFGCGGTNAGAGARTQTFGNFHAQLHAAFGFALLQGLCVCVGNDKINAIKLFLDHVVDCVAAGPAYAKNGDPGFQLFLSGHRKVQCHTVSA